MPGHRAGQLDLHHLRATEAVDKFVEAPPRIAGAPPGLCGRNRLPAYEKELEIGRRNQADFPPKSVPETENWEVAAYFEAAREVAGDFYDVFELKPGEYMALVIGDVCDKGVGAALFMTLFRSLKELGIVD